MAATLILDTLRQAIIVETSTGIRITRTGLIKGVKTLGVPNSEVFAQCVLTAGMPVYLDAYPHSRYADCKLRQRVFEPIEGDNSRVRVSLIYERYSGEPFAPATFILTRTTTHQEVMTELHPATKKPLTVVWRNPALATDVVRRTARYSMRQPIGRLVAQGFYESTPPAAMIDALNSVNDAPWRGLPKGYWYYAEQSDVTRDYGGSYTITLELWTKIYEDWSQFQALRDPNGRYLGATDADATELASRAYIYGEQQVNGLSRVGLYRLQDFGIFGFEDIGRL